LLIYTDKTVFYINKALTPQHIFYLTKTTKMLKIYQVLKKIVNIKRKIDFSLYKTDKQSESENRSGKRRWGNK